MKATKRQRQQRRLKKIRREPMYMACLLLHGTPPTHGWQLVSLNYEERENWKDAVVNWYMGTITSTPPPVGKQAGYAFMRRYLRWLAEKGSVS
jgi:hypothetical protein